MNRSPTHDDIAPNRLAAMGLELEDIADQGRVTRAALIELAEDRGRPPSHYIAAIPLATELALATDGEAVAVRVCAGTCQRWGALDLIDHLIERHPRVALVPHSCIDRCDFAPACEIDSPAGKLVVAPATAAALDDALAALS